MNPESSPGTPAWRIVVAVITSLLIVALGIYNVASASHEGSYGFSSEGGVVRSVVPGTPASQAGMQAGDRIDIQALPVLERSSRWIRAGTVTRFPIERNGHPLVLVIRAARRVDWAPGRVIDLLIEIAGVILACVVLLRAKRGELSGAIAGYTIWVAATAAVADTVVSAPTTFTAFFFNGAVQSIAECFQGYYAFRVIGLFPEGRTGAQRLALRLAPVNAFVQFLFFFPDFVQMFAPRYAIPAVGQSIYAATLIDCIAGFALLLWVALHVRPADRARMRWFASTLLAFQFFGFGLLAFYELFHWIPGSTATTILLFYLTNLGPVGPIYATLRHRLIDLDVVISRSAIYAALSVLIVGLFIGAEWLAGRISDAFVSESRRGLTTQILSFAIALAVGLWVRHVHAVIEKRVNGLFFRARTLRLQSLERFAYEADITDSRESLLNLTFQTLEQSIETPFVALYIADGAGFALVRSSDPSAAERLDRNDRLVLRLLRWPQAFQFDDPGAMHDWLIVPLMVRTNVMGFMACGPKADHTRYLPDELTALDTLAHHVATSYAFISSENAFRIDALRSAPA